MIQTEFNRRIFLKGMAGISALAAAGQLPEEIFAAAQDLKLWCPGIARPWKTWEPMEKRANIKIKWTVKSADAQESLQKMLVGGGQKLYDAFTDNGGGMEDAMAETKNIVPLEQPAQAVGDAASTHVRQAARSRSRFLAGQPTHPVHTQ